MFRANRFITTEIGHRKHFSMLFFSKPGPKYTLSTNRLSTGEKLIITSSVIKNVYVRPCLLLIRDHMQIKGWKPSFLNQCWWLKIFHVSQWQNSIFSKWSCWFKQDFLETPEYNCIYQRTTLLNFSAEEAIYSITSTGERRYHYVKCFSPLGLFPFQCSQFYHRNWS